jgi:DNA-binding transcriptional regulator LsrR (DeoR family)
MSRLNELRLMSRVAQLYYEQNQKQAQISELLHISQATVSRLIARAQAEGIVRITIAPPNGTYPHLEEGLRRRYGLGEAIVAECYEDREDPILSAVGSAAAYYLESTLGPGEVIGLSCWSATLLRMIDSVHPVKRVQAERVVQILGGIGNPSVQSHATQLTTRLASLTGAQPMLLPAQGVTASSAARAVMLEDAYIRETTAQFDRLTMALVGIGGLQPSFTLWNSGNAFSAEELTDLEQRGAIGDMCLRFFDAAGRAVESPFDERVTGITLAQLKAVPHVIAVAGGERKTAAIHGALLTGAVNTLVTDKFTAERILGQFGS